MDTATDTVRNNNRRIARNTLLLYSRTLLQMIVSLYTSRVVLSTLGVEDYGIYNVVGGLVSMFSVITGVLSAATSRFITFELGTGNKERLKKIFSTSLIVQILLGFIVALLILTVGAWFLNNKMVIPADRIAAANLVLCFSVITFIVNLVSIPYNATIIAHEKMSAFAYISIFEALEKLGVAYLITISPIDRLIFYAILMCIVAIITRFLYSIYCKRHFEECKFRFTCDKNLIRQMFSFAGWNFIGASSGMLREQGGNLIINLFYGPTVNAARGIAIQVNGAVNSFVSNFMTAVNPQITKSYASGDYAYMKSLLFQGARFSYYMLLVLSMPVLVNTEYILNLWLTEVPEHTSMFVQLVLLFTMSESISNPLITAMLATGNIRNYQIVVGGLQVLNLPVSYLLLRHGFIPETVMIVAIIISQLCLGARLVMLKDMIHLDYKRYLRKVYLNVLAVTALSGIIPVSVSFFITDTSFAGFLLLCFISLTCTVTSILFAGLSAQERKFCMIKTRQMLSKILLKNRHDKN